MVRCSTSQLLTVTYRQTLLRPRVHPIRARREERRCGHLPGVGTLPTPGATPILLRTGGGGKGVEGEEDGVDVDDVVGGAGDSFRGPVEGGRGLD